MLKSTKLSVVKPLCLLFNRSLKDCVFPKKWKLANVIPLFKKDDPAVLSNYRPVSLLSCVSKVMERIVFKHLYNYFHSNNIFYKYQAGFLPGHSTVYQLLETYDNIVRNIDEGKSCCMIFCDLSKAFDRVWHKGLLYKLKMYGVKKDMYSWLKSYLENRTQRVIYKNLVSPTESLYAGVPQGSVLGPLLFLIYVNDVADKMSSFCRLFADDNSLQYASKCVKSIEGHLNNDLLSLEEWSKKWLLKFNPSKTKVVFFNTRKNKEFPKLLFQDSQLEYVQTHKHLGVTFSYNLSWSSHIEILLSNAYKKLGLLKKLKFKINRKSLSLMYTSFIICPYLNRFIVKLLNGLFISTT